jgi:2-dehydro-3-deoxy-D-gluconate 5-dehydrogenase
MVLDSFRLAGRTAIVTGCRTGLGEAMAMGLAEAGADIVGVGRGSLDGIGEAIGGLGRRFVGIQADLSTLRPIGEIVERTLAEFGRIDILINNAGIIRRADAIDFSEKDWDDVLNVNLKTVFFLCQAVAKQYMKQGKGGKIVNVESMLSFQGGIRVPSYTASKSGLMGVTRLLANEWASHNINVNGIAPGYMVTDNTAALRADPVRNKTILERIPAGRWGVPDDLKGIAVFLASEASNYVNGFTIAVDGGWLAR